MLLSGKGLKLQNHSKCCMIFHYFTLKQGGTQQISKIIAKELGDSRVHLNEPVKSINQKNGTVVVETEHNKTYGSKKVILAIPPSQIGEFSTRLFVILAVLAIDLCPPSPLK